MSSFCKISLCTSNNTHVTSGHKCNSCSKYGHSSSECGDYSKLHDLSIKTCNDVLPVELHCKIDGCRFSFSHITKLHECHACKGHHSNLNCPERKLYLYEYKIVCPLCQSNNYILHNTIKDTNTDNNTNNDENDDNICTICLSDVADIILPECKHKYCLQCCNQMNQIKKYKSNYA